MVISFGIVLAILSRYGFPVIIQAIERRKEYIDQSLETARQANQRLADIHAEADQILAQARERQNTLLREAIVEKEHILGEARREAVAEAQRQTADATRRIREEKEKAIREIRAEITDLSLSIAEKVMREKINRDDEQQRIINRLLDEVSFSKS